MNDQERLFAVDYLRHFNASRAARTAGYSAHSSGRTGYDLLRRPEVQQYIADAIDTMMATAQADAGMVLREWLLLVKADPNEIVQMRRVCCRYCHGIDGGYQRTQKERERDYQAWECSTAGKDLEGDIPAFNEMGGIGYDATREPNPACFECFGEGVAQLHLTDTRDLSPGARALLAGVKQTKEGIEIKFHSKEKALENLAKHLGMLKEQVEVTGALELTERLARARKRTTTTEDDGSDLAG